MQVMTLRRSCCLVYGWRLCRRVGEAPAGGGGSGCRLHGSTLWRVSALERSSREWLVI